MATSKTSKSKPKPRPKTKTIKKPAKKSGAKRAKVSPVVSRARKLGLESMGYGRWGKNGRITHKTEGGKLSVVKDSKTNRVKTREGKAKATSILSKMMVDHTQKIVKIRMALKKAEGRGDDAKAKQLKSMMDRSNKEMQKAKERTIALHARKKKAA